MCFRGLAGCPGLVSLLRGGLEEEVDWDPKDFSTENRPGGVFPTASCGVLGYQADPSLAHEAGAVRQTLQK